jgi:hypothetical protein
VNLNDYGLPTQENFDLATPAACRLLAEAVDAATFDMMADLHAIKYQDLVIAGVTAPVVCSVGSNQINSLSSWCYTSKYDPCSGAGDIELETGGMEVGLYAFGGTFNLDTLGAALTRISCEMRVSDPRSSKYEELTVERFFKETTRTASRTEVNLNVVGVSEIRNQRGYITPWVHLSGVGNATLQITYGNFWAFRLRGLG